MKTPMQELIDDLKSHIKVDWPMNIWLRDRIKKGLKEEKDHIMMAFNDGRVSGLFKEDKSADKYYTLTYGKQEKL